MQACVIGLGRVGLPTAARAAAAGHRVHGVDLRHSAEIVRDARASPEPGLAALVERVIASEALTIGDTAVSAEVYVVCVGTPLAADGSTADLAAVDQAVRAVAAVCPPEATVILESTVPVGATDAAAAVLQRAQPGVRVAAAPERVWPGRALEELARNPRVVGGVDPGSARAAAAFLASCGCGPITETDARTAELCKLVENAARDVEIALANTVADLARVHGLDPYALRALVNQHPRVELRMPGIGVGGHCLPVDPWFLASAHPEHSALLRAARAINDARPAWWVEHLRAFAAGRRLGLLGLGYKADSDDLRGSPALAIARGLAAVADVSACDPYHTRLDGVPLVSLDEALRAPVVVLLVAHRAYRGLRERIGADQVVIDACGGWS